MAPNITGETASVVWLKADALERRQVVELGGSKFKKVKLFSVTEQNGKDP